MFLFFSQKRFHNGVYSQLIFKTISIFPDFLLQPIYKKVMPLYFPRNQEEEDFVVNELPDDIGKCCNLGSLIFI